MQMTYDSKSYELAEYFLEGDPDLEHLNTEGNRHALARVIQQAVENEIASMADNYDPTPYCSYGHRTKAACDCGPIAAND
jgi:hypothetical protein